MDCLLGRFGDASNGLRPDQAYPTLAAEVAWLDTPAARCDTNFSGARKMADHQGESYGRRTSENPLVDAGVELTEW